MDKKKLLAGMLLGVMAVTTPIAAVTLSGCEPKYESRGEDGSYYCVVGGVEYEATLGEDGFSVETASGTVTGTYKYDGTVFIMETEKGGPTVTAQLDGETLKVTIDGTEYVFHRQIFTVTYDMDGGSSVENEYVPNGKFVTKPAAPTKDGHVFIGWYADKGYNKKFDFEAPVTANTTVYARFVQSSLGEEFTVTLMNGDQKLDEMTTLNGVVYNLPTPTKDGATFLGWWVGLGSADKLSYEYDENKLGQNTTLYAVWSTDETIGLSVTEKSIIWQTKTVGAAKTTIYNPDGSVAYTRTSTENVLPYDFTKVAAGQYKVEVAVGGKTYTAYYNNKVLDAPCLFEVKENVFIFNKVVNAQKYLITVECGDAVHSHVDMELDADTNCFDFSACAMHVDGIKFTVKAVAEGYVTTTADTYVFDQKLDGVQNLKHNTEQATVTWDEVANAESYTVMVTDGKNSDSFTTTDRTIDVKGYTGNVEVTVTPNARLFNSTATIYSYESTRLVAPSGIALEGNNVTWTAVENATSYTLTINGKTYTATTNSFDISGAAEGLEMGKTYEVFVQANAATAADNSMKSDAFNLAYAVMSDNLTYQANTLKWSAVFGASKYGYRVNGGEEQFATVNEAKITLTQAGTNLVEVRLYDASGKADDEWVDLEVFAYTVTFAMDGGDSIDAKYFAAGDTLNLNDVAPNNMGYTFKGWTDEGDRMVGETFAVSGDATLKANWQANTYKVTLSTHGFVEGVKVEGAETSDVVFADGEFVLPVASSTDTTKVFMGWYTNINGQGTQCTDETGAAVRPWRYAENTTLYAKWGEVFEFVEVSDIDTGEQVYSVRAGRDIKLVTEITIPAVYQGKKVTTVESVAFKSCTQLTTVNIPNSIKLIEIGSDGGNSTGSAFQGCTKLEAINVFKVEGTHTVRYSSFEGVLYSVAEDVDGNVATKSVLYSPIAKEGEYVIEEGTTDISWYAFASSKLTKISVPHTVTQIEKGAFKSATSMTMLEFLATPDGTEDVPLKLGDQVFDSCTALETIVFPSRLGDIDVTTIKSCTKLQNLNIVGTGKYKSIDGVLCKVEGGITTLVYVPRAREGEYRIPSGVTRIGTNAFGSASTDRVLMTKVTIPAWVTEIEEAAFYYCNKLTEVVFEGDKESANLIIRKNAFYYCSLLESIVLPENLTVLEQGAFAGTSKLKDVSFNTAVTENRLAEDIDIQAGAFATVLTSGAVGTFYVEKLYIGEFVPDISIAGVFGNAKLANITIHENNQYYSSEDGVLFNKEKTRIVFFPVTRGGHYIVPNSVEEIGSGLFMGNTALTKITIGTGVTLIGEAAFKSCTYLNTVEFIEGGTQPLTIKDGAFYSCSGLTKIELAERTKVIEDNAFYSCSKLTEITLPKNLEKLGSYKTTTVTLANGETAQRDVLYAFSVFESCTKLKNVFVAEGNQYFTSKDGILYSNQYVDFTIEYTSDTAVTVKEDTFAIVPGAKFYGHEDGTAKVLLFCPRDNSGTNGTATVLASTMKIADNAFYYNGNATDSEGITNLVFEEVNNLTEDNELVIGKRVFYYMKDCQTITLPEGVKTIKARTFYYAGITYINLPASVETIEANAFTYANTVQKITFAEGGTQPLEILDDTTSTSTTVYYGAFSNCTKLEEVVLPARTSYIGKNAFAGCTLLKKINIPVNVTVIGEAAFRATTALTDVTLERSAYVAVNTTTVAAPVTGTTYYTLVEGVYTPVADLTAWVEGTTYYTLEESKLSTVGAYAFYTSGIEEVDLPDSVATIEKYAFYGTKNLSYLKIGKNITEIKEYAFYYSSSTNLTEIVFAEGSKLEKIGERAFYGQLKLNKLVLPSTVKEVGIYAFYGCRAIATLELNEGLEKIGDNAFTNICELTELVIPSTVTDIGASAFASTSSVYASKIAKITFRTNEDGKVALANIGDKAFSGTVITEFVFPESVTKFTFGGNMNIFSGCEDLTKVHISSSVLSVSGLFAGCDNIQTVTIAEENENLAVNNDMKMITSKDGKTISLLFAKVSGALTFDEGIEKIEASVFQGQTGITSVSFPKTMLSIGDNAFRDCTNLTSVTFAENTFLENIGAYAFAYTSLQKIEIPELVTDIGNYAFAGKSSSNLNKTLQEVKFLGLNNVTMGTYVFGYNGALTKVALPEGLTAIPNNAFYYCSALENVVFPTALKTIGSSSFSYCTSFKGNDDIIVKEATETEDAVVVKGVDLSKITKIDSSAFNRTTALKAVKIGKSVTTINGSAFRYSGIEHLLLEDGIKGAIGTASYVFANCDSLKEVSIPSSMNKFGTYMFYQCLSLEKVNLNQITTLAGANYMFSGCEKLNNVVIPGTVKGALGTYLFQNCKGLTNITVEEGVENLSTYMFSECTALQSFTVPSTIKTTATYVLRNTTALTELKFAVDPTTGNAATINANYFTYHCDNLKEITIPAALKLYAYMFAYSGLEKVNFEKDANGNTVDALPNYLFYYSKSLKEFTVPASVDTLGTNVFYYCTALEKVDFESHIGADGITPTWHLTSIPNYTFYHCEALTSVKLPDTIETIGNYAFAYSGLTEITIPASVTTMGTTSTTGYSFAYCYSLKKVTFAENSKLTTLNGYIFYHADELEEISLPEGLTSIGNSTFRYTNLKSVYIPSTIESMGTYLFADTPSLETVTFGLDDQGTTKVETIPIYTFYNATSLKNIVLPQTITTIGGNSFRNTGIESIVIPDSVTELGLDTDSSSDGCLFYECKNLKEITLPSKLEVIGWGTFQGCSALEKIVLPDTVKSLGLQAFYKCTGLKEFTIGSGLTKVGRSALRNTGISSIDIPANVKLLDYAALYDNPNLENITLHEGLEEIGEWVFSYNDKLTELKLPNSVKSIGGYAFAYLNISEITLPSSLTMIGAHAFDGMPLTKIDIPAGVTEIGDKAFANCDVLVSVNFSSSTQLTRIGANAFENCVAITSFSIPSTVLEIGDMAFMGTSIDYISIPQSVVSIGNMPFYNCQLLTEINVNSANTMYKTRNKMLLNALDEIVACPMTVTGEITIEEGTNIGDYAFAGCTGITKVNLPETVAKLGDYAFYHCTELSSIVLPELLDTIGSHAFDGCMKLTELNVSNVKTFGAEFAKGSGITSVELNANIGVNGAGAFDGLISVKIADGMTVLPEEMFANATTLKTVILPQTLVTISDSAFENCTALEEIVIPDTVTEIGNKAFYNAINLKKVVLGSSVKTIGNSAFENTLSLTDFDLNDVVESIGNMAFKKSAIQHITIPESLSSVGTTTTNASFAVSGLKTVTFAPGAKTQIYMFYANHNLEEVQFADDMTEISNYAFYYCGALKKVDLSNTSVELIGTYAFGYALSLTEVILPETLVEIGNYAFSNYNKLTTITLPSKLTKIGTSAFSNAYLLKEIINLSTLNVTVGNTSSTVNGYLGQHAVSVLNSPATAATTKIVREGDFEFVLNKDGVYEYVGYKGTSKNLVFPDSVDGEDYIIPNRAFYGNHHIESVVLGKGCKSIGEYAFAGQSYTRALTSFGSNLKSIVLNEGLETIGKNAFYSATSLEEIVLPSTVTDVSTYAFEYCHSLRKVDLSKTNLTVIGNYTFAYCVRLSEVILPDTLEEFGTYVFYYNSALKRIELPATLKKIGNYCFGYCYTLYEVVNYSALDVMAATNTSNGVKTYAKLVTNDPTETNLVKQGDFTFWYDESADTWKLLGYTGKFEKDFVLPDYFMDGETQCTYEVDAYAFMGTSTSSGYGGLYGVERLYVGKGCTKVGKYAFSSSHHLREVYLPASVTNVETYAFYASSTPQTLYAIFCEGSSVTFASSAYYTTTSTNVGYLSCSVYYNVDFTVPGTEANT